MGLPEVCAAAAAIAASPGTGIRRAYYPLPDALGKGLPVATVEPQRGRVSRAGDALWVHTLFLHVFVDGRSANLPVELAPAAAMVGPVEAAFFAATAAPDGLPRGVSRIAVTDYEVTGLVFAGQTYTGVRFTLDAKEHTP